MSHPRGSKGAGTVSALQPETRNDLMSDHDVSMILLYADDLDASVVYDNEGNGLVLLHSPVAR